MHIGIAKCAERRVAMYSRNYGCRITDQIIMDGNKAVVMENQKLRLTFLADRGMDCVEMLYKPEDIDFMWRSPAGLHKRSEYLSNSGNSLGNYLDHNSGGWQEILPNGGGECSYKGACLGMHGEISSVPWDCRILKDSEEEVVLKACITTLRSPFRLEKEISLKRDESAITIRESLTNLAKEPMELMWGHHPTVGKPFLDSSCRIDTNGTVGFSMDQPDFETQRLKPGTRFEWPAAGNGVDFSNVPGEDADTADMIYITGFPERAWYRVHNETKNISYGMSWDGKLFPYMWMWQVCGGSYGYPWYGRTYNLALEPWTSYPSSGLIKAIENGSALCLEAGEIRQTELCFWIKKEEI